VFPRKYLIKGVKVLAEYIGYVTERKGQRAKVKIDRTRYKGTNVPKFLDCWNACEAKVGSEVEVGRQEVNPRKAKLIVYGIPLLCAVAGAVFGNGIARFFRWPFLESVIGGAVLWLVLGWSYVGPFRKEVVARGEQWTITGIYYGDTKDAADSKKQPDVAKAGEDK
jgi:positive regulator of sigma E activity